MRPLTLSFAGKIRAASSISKMPFKWWAKTGTPLWVDRMLSDDHEEDQGYCNYTFDYSSFISLHVHKTWQFDTCCMLQKQILITSERDTKMWVCHKSRQTRNIFFMHLDKYFELLSMEIQTQMTDHLKKIDLKPNSPCLIWNVYRHTSFYLSSYSVTDKI